MKFENFEQAPTADQNDHTKKEAWSQIDEEPSQDKLNAEAQSLELLEQEESEVQETEEDEIRPEQATIEKTESAEQKLSEFLEDGQRQIEAIENSIDLPEEDIAAVREEIGLTQHTRRIEGEANGLLGSLKEKLSIFFTKDKTPDAAEEDLDFELPEGFRAWRYEQRVIPRPIIEEAKRKRDQLLEARGLFSMSKEDFTEYFSSNNLEAGADLQQQNVGECYAVAAVHAMSCSPHFEMICRSSMERLSDGSWQVKIPLMSNSSSIITITQEDIAPQWNKELLRPDKIHKFALDLRPKLKPVKGKEGLQVLVAAFIKAKFGTVDRLAAEGGRGDEVLLQLGGSNFKKYQVSSATYDEKTKKVSTPGLDSLEGEQKMRLDNYLENFDPEVHIATAGTKIKRHKLPLYTRRGTFHLLAPRHAYSITGVDKDEQIITIANPWDTSKRIELTFKQFKENFSSLEAVRIDSGRLLYNMKRFEDEAS